MLLVELVLFLAPAALLVLSLALERYPGERALWRLSSRSPLWPRFPSRFAAPCSPGETPPRGTLLIARSLAERAPPPVIRPA
jgi:hypothetical protein